MSSRKRTVRDTTLVVSAALAGAVTATPSPVEAAPITLPIPGGPVEVFDSQFSLDINGDSVYDLLFSHALGVGGNPTLASVAGFDIPPQYGGNFIPPQDGGGAFIPPQYGGSGYSAVLWMDWLMPRFAAARDAADRFGRAETGAGFAELFNSFSSGPWESLDGTSAYLNGLFEIPGRSPHQFWVQLSVDPADGGLTLETMGYETETFAGTTVPEPSTLALIALGMSGLAELRRRRRRTTSIS